jgi:hypothetical protein
MAITWLGGFLIGMTVVVGVVFGRYRREPSMSVAFAAFALDAVD